MLHVLELPASYFEEEKNTSKVQNVDIHMVSDLESSGLPSCLISNNWPGAAIGDHEAILHRNGSPPGRLLSAFMTDSTIGESFTIRY